jgi:hypothetical protein
VPGVGGVPQRLEWKEKGLLSQDDVFAKGARSAWLDQLGPISGPGHFSFQQYLRGSEAGGSENKGNVRVDRRRGQNSSSRVRLFVFASQGGRDVASAPLANSETAAATGVETGAATGVASGVATLAVVEVVVEVVVAAAVRK